MITCNTRICKIVSRPEFKGYQHMLGFFPGHGGVFSGMLKLSALCKRVGTWDANSMAEGANYLSKRSLKDTVFFHIYTEGEHQSDPSKKLTGVAAFPVEKKSKFVVVCAGGGYGAVCSMAEAYPIVKVLNEMGYAAFSVQYRVGKNAAAPKPMDDLARAVRFILDHADEMNVEKEDYAVMGFSAGGHLAASFGTENLGYNHYGLPAPGVLMLAYPVITMGEKTHKGSRKRLFGEKAEDYAVQKQYSIEQQITCQYPPTYVWQFDQDNAVPIENTQMLVNALQANDIPYVYETFSGTIHGAGIGVNTPAAGWIDRAVAFWEDANKQIVAFDPDAP